MAARGWLKFALRRALPGLAALVLLLASLKLAKDAAGGVGVGRWYRWMLGAACRRAGACSRSRSHSVCGACASS